MLDWKGVAIKGFPIAKCGVQWLHGVSLRQVASTRAFDGDVVSQKARQGHEAKSLWLWWVFRGQESWLHLEESTCGTLYKWNALATLPKSSRRQSACLRHNPSWSSFWGDVSLHYPQCGAVPSRHNWVLSVLSKLLLQSLNWWYEQR